MKTRVYKLDGSISVPGLSHKNALSLWLDKLMPLLRRGEPVAERWTPLPVTVQTFDDFHDATVRTKKQSRAMYEQGLQDCADSLAPVFSRRVREELEDLFRERGEFLPVDFDGNTNSYFLFHCIRMSDALDLKKSEYKYFGETLGTISKYAFDKKKLAGETIFRLAIDNRSIEAYVTDLFVDRVKASNLTGFEFEEVWSG